MEEENFEQHGIDNMQEEENAHGIDNVQGEENVHGIDNVQEKENAHGIDNVQEEENAHGIDIVQEEENAHGIDNVQEEENAHGIDNVQGEENVNGIGNVQEKENAHGIDNVQEEENAHGIDNAQEEENAHGIDNVQKEENAHGIDNVQEEENAHGIDNVQEEENAHGVDNVHKEENAPEDIHPPEDIHEPENNLVIPSGKKWPGWPGENVFRMLVPCQKIGGIIGRKGEQIKKICEETKARIKILDAPPGSTEKAVMVSATGEPGLAIPPAMDGLLRIHKQIIDSDSEPTNAQSGRGKISTRLLVPATHAAFLIGRQGASVKSIQDSSGCTIRVLRGEHLPVFALADDSIVDIQGEPAGLHKAVELIAAHLRRFLVHRSVIGVFEVQMQMLNGQTNQNMPPPQSWGPPPQAFPMAAGGDAGYGPPPQYVPPPYQYDNYYPPTDMPSLDKPPRNASLPYGRDASAGAHASSFPQQQSMVQKVTKNMQLPVLYADAVIGTSGSNISYIRRSSGATVAIQESRGVPGEMAIEINGSASQVQTAQQLVQNSIADALASMRKAAGGPPAAQDYNPYSRGPFYSSTPSNNAGYPNHASPGDYGSNFEYSHGY